MEIQLACFLRIQSDPYGLGGHLACEDGHPLLGKEVTNVFNRGIFENFWVVH